MFRFLTLVAIGFAAPAGAAPKDDVTALRSAATPEAARAAWDRLASAGPDALLPILCAWPEDDPVAGFWLATAFDRLAERHRAALPLDGLMDVLTDPDRPGRARRLALSAVESARPGTRACLFRGWLNDPEFGGDVIDERIAEAEAALEAGRDADAAAVLTAALEASADVEQAFALGSRLGRLGVAADVPARLGIVLSWEAERPGADGRRARVVAPATDGKADLVRAGFDPADGPVVLARAAVILDADVEAELRVGAVDNVSVRVNGGAVLEYSNDYRSHFRTDRHRVPVRLRAGTNVIELTLSKTPPDEELAGAAQRIGRPVAGGPAPKWDFMARLVRPDGRGLPHRQPEDTGK